MTLAERMKIFRAREGITQEEAGHLIRASKNHIYLVEKGRRKLGPDKLAAFEILEAAEKKSVNHTEYDTPVGTQNILREEPEPMIFRRREGEGGPGTEVVSIPRDLFGRIIAAFIARMAIEQIRDTAADMVQMHTRHTDMVSCALLDEIRRRQRE